MIPQAYITEWQSVAPWDDPNQIEQDLIISRALVELFRDEHVCKTLAFRGGTAMHKLYLSPAARYSEDIDLVQIIAGPIGKTLDCGKITDSFVHYLAGQNRKVTAKQFQLNLAEKRKDRNFGADVLPLLRNGVNFSVPEALQRVEDNLILLLDSAWCRFKSS